MAIVWYEQYRQHDEQRIVANDAMMALVAGSKLAAHTLQLTEGSGHRLSELFPSVPHIERLDITTESARRILDDAEGQLGTMAVPYVIAIHEDLLVGMCSLLRKDNLISRQRLNTLKSANTHECIEDLSGERFSETLLDLFHLMRVVRNARIHSGGRADAGLKRRLKRVDAQSLARWRSFTKEQFPNYRAGDPVQIGLPELIGTLAITKRLAEEANHILQLIIPRGTWADMVIAEWASAPSPGNPAQTLRKIRGIARHHFGALKLTEDELRRALRRKQ